MYRLVSRLVLAAGLVVTALAGSQAALAQTAPANASVTVNDGGFSPASVSIGVGGLVTWTNTGTDTHNASSQGQAPLPFDTGGVSPGQSASVGFNTPGTYHYTSATDCRNGVQKPNFNCGADYTVIVGGTAAAPAPAAPAAAPAPSVAPSAAAPATAAVTNASVSIGDTGFTPNAVTIGLGGSVMWTNSSSSRVHTATAAGIRPVGFDTGAWAPVRPTPSRSAPPAPTNTPPSPIASAAATLLALTARSPR